MQWRKFRAGFTRGKLVFLAGITCSLYSCQGKKYNTSQRHPNVLFIAIDDLAWWKRYGAVTPNLDRLLEEGISFSNAYCASPISMASRHSMLSGLHPIRTGWYDYLEPIKRSYDSVISQTTPLPLFFKEHGYETMACGKIYHSGPVDFPVQRKYWDTIAPPYIVDKAFKKNGINYGGDHFYPFPDEIPIFEKFGSIPGLSLCGGPLQKEDIPGGKMHDQYVADWGISQINADHNKPFFLALGFARPHVPYTAPEEFFKLYDPDAIQLPVIPADEMADIPVYGKATAFGLYPQGDHYTILQIGTDYWKSLIHSYLACISFVDGQVGRVLDALDNSQGKENTIVVLWSDNGQGLGEKVHWRKMALWEESVNVPMVFRIPGSPMRGRKVDDPAGLIDIYPTLADVCNLPAPGFTDGKSLKPYFNDPHYIDSVPELSVWGYGNFRVSGKNWIYIRYRDGSEELYDNNNDRFEHNNIADNKEFYSEKIRLKKYIPRIFPLPPGVSEWEDDDLDKRVKGWLVNGIPSWLDD